MLLGTNVVWGVTSNDEIFYRDGPGGSWIHIDGGLKQIDIGELGTAFKNIYIIKLRLLFRSNR